MSREIDARVHVEVMGGRFVQRYSTMGTREVEVCRAGAYPIVIQDGKDVPYSAWDGAWHIGQLPHYSTDPAAAMEVVERMRVLGYDYEIRSDGDRVVVTFYCPPDSGGMSCGVDVDGPAKELCATIARSALRAVAGLGVRA